MQDRKHMGNTGDTTYSCFMGANTRREVNDIAESDCSAVSILALYSPDLSELKRDLYNEIIDRF